MRGTRQTSPVRLLGLFLVGPVFLLLLTALAYLHFKLDQSGITGAISQTFGLKPVREFGLQFGLRMLLPLYIGAGTLAWASTFLPAAVAKPGFYHGWKGRETWGLGCSALLWVHLVLWWQVPTALWVLPLVRTVPFVLLFPILAVLALAYPVHWLRRHGELGLRRRGALLGSWVALWTLLALGPQWLPRLKVAPRPGDQPCKVLILGIDGLRSDTFLSSSAGYEGIRYENAYTVIPATRLLWHIIWGGDPMLYTIGHVAPSDTEFLQPHNLVLLKKAMAKGLKPRFYMDDGGTIGTAGRRMDLDDILMPATGWENFVNSNLAVSFPVYAVWENILKPFPTTNPWAPLDAGVKEALRLGRGSGWVMFHSCLAHQPIFLARDELWQTGRWWTLSPLAYQPLSSIDQVTPKILAHVDFRTNTFRAYQIRMRSILQAWKPVWSSLAQDPAYKSAVRVLFSDHGERFHNVAKGFQLQGVHGYNLDPWECRATMLVAGPGFADAVEPRPREASVSLLGLRDGINRILDGKTFDSAYFESCTPKAPFRYHTLSMEAFGSETLRYREEPLKDLAISTYMVPGGIWFTIYKKSAEERAKDASVGYASGSRSTYLKPLKDGGAEETTYQGYELVSEKIVDEAAFQKVKAEVEQILKDDQAAIQ